MKVNAEILNLVTDRASLFQSKEKGYLISFTSIKTSDGDFVARLVAGNGQAQSSVVFPYKSNEPLHEPLFLSSTLKEAVSALAKSQEDIQIKKEGGVVVMSSKNAKINIPLLTFFDQILPPDEDLLTCEVCKKELLSAIKQGGASATDSEKPYSSCIMLRPGFDGDNLFLSLFSVSSIGRSYARTSVKAKNTDVWMDYANEKKTYLIPNANISRISSVLRRENTTLYLGDSCLLVRDGNDLFSFLTFSEQPAHDFIPFFNYEAASLKASIQVSALDAVLSAASIGTDPKRPKVKLSIAETTVTATSENGNSASAELCTSSNGKWSGIFNPLQLKSILKNIGSDEVTIHSTGDEGKPVIYITADNVSAISVATGFLN